MTDRVRDFSNFEPLAAFCAKYLPDFPAAKMGELAVDIIECAIIHIDPVPGSSPDVRAQAVQLMQEFVESLEEGANVNPDMLKDAGGLPRNNRSDTFFVRRWAKENHQLTWNPSTTSHFIKKLTDGNSVH